MRNCPNCEKEFKPSRIDNIYCTKRCKNQAKDKRKANPYYVRVTQERIKPVFSLIYSGYCQQCKKAYVSKHKTKYCSRVCLRKFHSSKPENKERNRKRHFYLDGRGAVKTCVCATCKTTFNTNHKRRYCTPKCSPHHKEPVNKTPRTCPRCINEFIPNGHKQVYCSRGCYPAGWVKKTNFYNTKEWKSLRAEYVNYFTIINGYPLQHKYCHECFRKSGNLKPMFAVDHIIPRRLGGLDSISNLQSLCRHHHQSKSAAEGNSERYKYIKQLISAQHADRQEHRGSNISTA